jgi:hypothetical protein
MATERTETSYLYKLINNERKTSDTARAIRAAKKTGRKPIEFISPRCRAMYLKVMPELGRKVK